VSENKKKILCKINMMKYLKILGSKNFQRITLNLTNLIVNTIELKKKKTFCYLLTYCTPNCNVLSLLNQKLLSLEEPQLGCQKRGI